MPAITLTKNNAHRVLLIKRKSPKDSPEEVFRYKGKQTTPYLHEHLVGEGANERVLPCSEFKDWSIIKTAHPGYLEDCFEIARNAYSWSSFSPEERADSDIARYEQEIHEDLASIPESEHENYISSYRMRVSEVWYAQSRTASSMITGPAGFNARKNEKAVASYENKYALFREWRERCLRAIQKKYAPHATSEDEWKTIEREINRTAEYIVKIDTGEFHGYTRASFVISIVGRIERLAKRGQVELVERSLALIREWNAKCQKPIITEKNHIFQLGEMAQQSLEKLQERQTSESKEVEFSEGKVVWNYSEDRLQILFDDIPSTEMRTRLKQRAFRWSHKNSAWQRQLTPNAVHAASQLLNVTLN